MIYSNKKIVYDLDFEAYLGIPAISNSKMKGDGKEFKLTDKVLLGKEVDEILTNKNYKSSDRKALQIVENIRAIFGPLLDLSKMQVSAFCTAEDENSGLSCYMKTRPDIYLPNIATIDLKVTAEPLRNLNSLIEFMGYEEQCFMHRTFCSTPESYLLVYSSKDNKSVLRQCTKDCTYWIEKALTIYGE
jgi:hypothetical protein